MTKKYLKQLANIYSFCTNNGTEKADEVRLYQELQNFCKGINPLFDENRFYKACHGEPFKK